MPAASEKALTVWPISSLLEQDILIFRSPWRSWSLACATSLKGLEIALERTVAKIMEIIGDKGTLESKSKPDERTKSIIVAPARAK